MTRRDLFKALLGVKVAARLAPKGRSAVTFSTVLEKRTYSVAEIARLFRVPLHMVS